MRQAGNQELLGTTGQAEPALGLDFMIDTLQTWLAGTGAMNVLLGCHCAAERNQHIQAGWFMSATCEQDALWQTHTNWDWFLGTLKL